MVVRVFYWKKTFVWQDSCRRTANKNVKSKKYKWIILLLMRRSQNSLNETQMCGSNLSQILDWKGKFVSNYRHKGLQRLFSIFW